MIAFALHLVLALIWTAAVGTGGPTTFALGFVIAYLILAWLRPVPGTAAYVRRLPRVLSFLGFYLGDLVLATLRVAWDVVTPKDYRRPGIIAVPLDVEGDFEITLLANLITLTPGTLSLDLSPDRRVLYVHAMFVDDADALRAEIKEGLERRVLELVR